MTVDEHKTSITTFCQQLVGTSVSASNMTENIRFIDDSKRQAATYEWLYHCTTSEALKSILVNREFWLSNLKLVNDCEEAERIDVQEYEKTYYICCSSYDKEIPEENWEEYGNGTNGVLIAIKPEWFRRQAVFMNTANQKCNDTVFCILRNNQEAIDFKTSEYKKGRIVNPFYINAFGFYQVIYDDQLKKYIAGDAVMHIGKTELNGMTLTPEIGGIVKSTHGICRRPGKPDYDKDWTKEKEVRLKVGIQQYTNMKNGCEMHDNMIFQDFFFPKIAIPITENAFDVLKIRLSPKLENKDGFIEELKSLISSGNIEFI
ncbi:MAG: hypothetical protein LUG93_12730 [Lachnospiraceae bacterium]|nr:hypothetical protein [Lachnospiraceae bacterium]